MDSGQRYAFACEHNKIFWLQDQLGWATSDNATTNDCAMCVLQRFIDNPSRRHWIAAQHQGQSVVILFYFSLALSIWWNASTAIWSTPFILHQQSLLKLFVRHSPATSKRRRDWNQLAQLRVKKKIVMKRRKRMTMMMATKLHGLRVCADKAPVQRMMRLMMRSSINQMIC